MSAHNRIFALFREEHDKTTEQGRSRERVRLAAWASMASLVARATGFITALVSVPLTLHYLGAERYGMWMTMSALLAMLGFADLGIGNGLMTSVAHCHGRDDVEGALRHVSSAFFMLSAIGAIVFSVFWIGSITVPWDRVFNVHGFLAVREAGLGMLMLVAGFAINMPLGVVQRTQTGLQGGFQSSLWLAVGNLLGLAFVLLAISLSAGLPWLVLAMSLGPIVAATINFVVFFWIQRPALRPRLSQFSKATARELLGIGLLFLVLQISMSFAMSSDNLIAAQVLGAKAVAELAVPARLFSIVASIGAVMTTPLWPAYGEAISRGDVAWVTRTLRRSLIAMFLFSTSASLALALFGRPIVAAWVGATVKPTVLLLLCLAAWTILSVVGNAAAMFLNGAKIVRLQVVTATLFATAGVLLKWVLGSSMGVSGIVLGGIVAFTSTVIIPYTFLLPRYLTSHFVEESEKVGAIGT